MDVSRVLLKAIYHKKWVDIEYKSDGSDVITRYWIAIKDYRKYYKEGKPIIKLKVKMFNVAMENSLIDGEIYLDRILSCVIKEGTYYADTVNMDGKTDIDEVFPCSSQESQINVLEYFLDCNQLDSTPYISQFLLVLGIDQDTLLVDNCYHLNDDQYKNLIRLLGKKKENSFEKTIHLAVNEISIHANKGLYVLAYRNLVFDLERHVLLSSGPIIANKRFAIKDKDGNINQEFSAEKFLDEEDCALLDDINVTKDKIKDALMKNVRPGEVDDAPHIFALSYNQSYLGNEYNAIQRMIEDHNLTYPLKCFFGQVMEKPKRTATLPISIISPANLDQMLVIYKALKFPTTYVQGPPGTGKTKTIVNTIISAFFNNKTVLVSTNNNVPLDGIYHSLSSLKYRNEYETPFPVLRLGNDESILDTLSNILSLIDKAKVIRSDEEQIKKVKERFIKKKDQLRRLMEDYEKRLDYTERKELLEDQVVQSAFSLKRLQVIDPQLEKINGVLSSLNNIEDDNEELKTWMQVDKDIVMYIHFESANRIKKLSQPKYKDFMDILLLADEKERLKQFKSFIQNDDNLELLLKVFPVILTTNMSAGKIGTPSPHFDLIIMDEAGQCSAAHALVPILRGRNLLLVGDPNQLKPVIMLDRRTNETLKEKYNIDDTYDYRENSILKMFYTNDVISDLILLRTHYRCHPSIIGFNNAMFYNNQLKVATKDEEQEPLEYIEMAKSNVVEKRNTSDEEATFIVSYCAMHPEQQIGVITPFKNQKQLIDRCLQDAGISDRVSCGTIHEFQGDEKDVIIFSTTISKNTWAGTYSWLKDNDELINVATSRAKHKLLMLANANSIETLHNEVKSSSDDHFYELYQYIKKKGAYHVPFVEKFGNRATGLKPFSTILEKAFMDNLAQVISTNNDVDIVFQKEVPVSSFFTSDDQDEVNTVFLEGRFDFVLFRKDTMMPILAIELNGEEHTKDESVQRRDEKKKTLCQKHGFNLVSIENAYARRYGYLKETLFSILFKEKK